MSKNPGDTGAGSGKAGSGGGAIRERDGGFNKIEAAREEEYFYKKVSAHFRIVEMIDKNCWMTKSIETQKNVLICYFDYTGTRLEFLFSDAGFLSYNFQLFFLFSKCNSCET